MTCCARRATCVAGQLPRSIEPGLIVGAGCPVGPPFLDRARADAAAAGVSADYAAGQTGGRAELG